MESHPHPQADRRAFPGFKVSSSSLQGRFKHISSSFQSHFTRRPTTGRFPALRLLQDNFKLTSSALQAHCKFSSPAGQQQVAAACRRQSLLREFPNKRTPYSSQSGTPPPITSTSPTLNSWDTLRGFWGQGPFTDKTRGKPPKNSAKCWVITQLKPSGSMWSTVFQRKGLKNGSLVCGWFHLKIHLLPFLLRLRFCLILFHFISFFLFKKLSSRRGASNKTQIQGTTEIKHSVA